MGKLGGGGLGLSQRTFREKKCRPTIRRGGVFPIGTGGRQGGGSAAKTRGVERPQEKGWITREKNSRNSGK